jgi:hypothetical protein
MRQINGNEIQYICGGFSYGSLIDVSAALIGGYLGSSLAYIEPLMTRVTTIDFAGPVLTNTSVYTPDTLILISGIILGAGIGYAVSYGFQQLYYS